MSKHSKTEKHKQKSKKHHEQTGKKEFVCDMGTTSPSQSPHHPRRPYDDSDYSPTPGAMMRRFVVWLRGFHWNREKAKVTDWLVAGLTLAVAVAAFWSAWIFQGQLHEAQKSTRLAVRPWIGLDEGPDAIENTPLQIDENGNASLVYTIRTKNYSSTPATNVWVDANLVVADDLNTVYEQQGYACGDAVIGKPDIGLVLFQGRDRTFNSMPSLTKINLKHKNSLIGVWLAGCIGYRDQFAYLCRTRFIWGFQDETGRPVSLQAPVPAMTIKGRFFATASGGAIDTCQILKYK